MKSGIKESRLILLIIFLSYILSAFFQELAFHTLGSSWFVICLHFFALAGLYLAWCIAHAQENNKKIGFMIKLSSLLGIGIIIYFFKYYSIKIAFLKLFYLLLVVIALFATYELFFTLSKIIVHSMLDI